MNRTLLSLVSLAAVGALLGLELLQAPASHAEARFSPFVDEAGRIERPTNFRKDFVHLGSWFVPGGDASGFHDVYTQRGVAEAYRETGHFPDGAVLVKELRANSTGDYTTGSGVHYANAGVKQWFVMVKDSKGRFPDNPLWGRGWGWGLFKPDAPSVNVAKDYQTDCLGCHLPAQANDLVYVEAYPTLAK